MQSFGHQLAYSRSVMQARQRLFDAGLGPEAVESRAQLAAEYSKVIMQIIVSSAVLIGGLVLLFRGNEATQKIASGLIGTVVGYWLR